MNPEGNAEAILPRLRSPFPEFRACYEVDTLEVFGSRVRADVGREMDSRVPWKEMAGVRGKLIQAYETVDVEIILKTVREPSPGVEPRVRALLERLRVSP